MPNSHPVFPYDASVASKYDSLRGWRPPIPERILAVAGARPGCRFLDLACGTGNLMLALHSRCAAPYVGIDLSPDMLRIARGKLPQAVFVRGNVARMPFATGSFDALAGAFFIHHVPEADRPRFFQEAYRVLKNGCLAIVTRSHSQIRECLIGRFFPEAAEMDQRRFPEIGQIEAGLREAGFREVFSEPIVDREIVVNEAYVKWMEGRPISTLDMIPGETFTAGIARLRAYAASPQARDERQTPFTLVFARKV